MTGVALLKMCLLHNTGLEQGSKHWATITGNVLFYHTQVLRPLIYYQLVTRKLWNI